MSKDVKYPIEPSIEKLLDIPFKEFMPGQIIQSSQFNDDMLDIEDKVNEIITKHNGVDIRLSEHQRNLLNPHCVTAEQINAYEVEDVDALITDVKNGNLNNESITNRVLADACVDNRVLVDGAVTLSKLDTNIGNQIDISNNMSIKERYTKLETDAIIQEKVGDGTYSKEQIDAKFEEYQAGTIIDGTIDASKLKENVGELLDISNNSAFDNYVSNEYLTDTILPTLATKEDCSVISNELRTSINSVDNKVDSNYTNLSNRLSDIQTNIASSHNHDDRYVSNYDAYVQNSLSVGNIRLIGRDVVINNKRALVGYGSEDGNKLVVNYNGDFAYGTEIIGTVTTHDFWCKGRRPFLEEYREGYYGLCTPDANNLDWIRTTQNGIIPFQSGGYSNIGTSSWRFNEGWFNYLNSHTLNLSKNGDISSINFSATANDPGFIRHIENNNTSRMVFSVSDDLIDGDQFWFGSAPGGNFNAGAILTSDGRLWLNRYIETAVGSMTMGGRHIYFDGQRPSHAPEGSISFG